MKYKLGGYVREEKKIYHWDFSDLALKLQTDGDIDLRPYSSPRHNQGGLSSCSANATVKVLEIKRIMKYGKDGHVDLSRLMNYYLARELMGNSAACVEDDGTFLSCNFDALRKFGVSPEADWPYDPEMVNISPSWKAMEHAYLHKITEFYRIMSDGEARLTDVRMALRSGNPIAYGTMIGNNWMDYKAGEVLIIPETFIGGHATVLLGTQGDNFIGENSWGGGQDGWGDDGFYLISPEVIASNLSDDFWVCQTFFDGE